MTNTIITEFTSYKDSVKKALDIIEADTILAKEEKVLIKPNLVNSMPFPVTTPPACCEAVIEYIIGCSKAEIVIAEGCGDKDLDTDEIFTSLGYNEISEKFGIPLIDLNHAELQKQSNDDCQIFPDMYLPKIAFTHYIISVPVLKAHSLSKITGSLKNMIGFAPPKYYSGKFGIWKKAVFHENIHQSITELNRYKTPDLTVLDARVGLAEYHLGGPECEPPVNKIIAGFDPADVDRKAAALLEIDWKTIPHLQD